MSEIIMVIRARDAVELQAWPGQYYPEVRTTVTYRREILTRPSLLTFPSRKSGARVTGPHLRLQSFTPSCASGSPLHTLLSLYLWS